MLIGRGSSARAYGAPRLVAGTALVGVVAAVSVGIGLGVLALGRSRTTVAAGVRVDDLSLGGMTFDQAVGAIREHFADRLEGSVTLEYGKDKARLSRRSLGVTVDPEATARAALGVGHSGGLFAAWQARRTARGHGTAVPPAMAVDEQQLTAALSGLRSKVERKAEPAQVRVSGDSVEVEPDVPGRELDVESTRVALAEAVLDLSRDTVSLQVREARAAPTADDLRGISCVIGSYATDYDAGESNRAGNIALAASSVTDVLLAPGERMSYNKLVGDRTAERGFKLAHVYEEGEVREGTGGGICQVSTTLYNAALLSGLNVVERSPHMMPVGYVPTGRDATVDYRTNIDLVIENNLPHPVYLVTSARGGTIKCSFLGASEDKAEKVEIVRSAVKSVDYQKVEVKDASLTKGARAVKQEGRRGYSVTVYRVIKMPGRPETKELLSEDSYPSRSEITRVSPVSPESEAKSAAEAAKKAAAAKGTSAASRPSPKPGPGTDSAPGATKSPDAGAPGRAGPEDA